MTLEISIVNYFEEGLSRDTFVQGFAILFVLSASLLFLLYLHPRHHTKNESFPSFLSRYYGKLIRNYFNGTATGTSCALVGRLVRFAQLVSLSTTVIILSLILGAIFSNVSNNFMDQPDALHLGWKKTWASDPETPDLADTKKVLKSQIFTEFFGPNALNSDRLITVRDSLGFKLLAFDDTDFREKMITEMYYASKHRILESPKWKDYLDASQKLAILNQTFCFGSWIFLCVAYLGFFVTLIMSFRDKLYNPKKNDPVSGRHTWPELILLAIFAVYLIANILIAPKYMSESGTVLMIAGASLLFLLQFRFIHGHRLNTSIVLVLIGITSYHLTAISWKFVQKECIAKTYGLMIHMDPNLSRALYKTYYHSIGISKITDYMVEEKKPLSPVKSTSNTTQAPSGQPAKK